VYRRQDCNECVRERLCRGRYQVSLSQLFMPRICTFGKVLRKGIASRDSAGKSCNLYNMSWRCKNAAKTVQCTVYVVFLFTSLLLMQKGLYLNILLKEYHLSFISVRYKTGFYYFYFSIIFHFSKRYFVLCSNYQGFKFKYSKSTLINPKPIAVDVLIKAYPMVPFSCRSNLAERYL
jgi:hypothetical protein